MPPRPDDDVSARRYGLLGADPRPVGPGQLRVQPWGGGPAQLLGLAEARVLAALHAVATLDAHADACLRALPPSVLDALPDAAGADARGRVGAVLRGFVARGVLTAEADVLDAMAADGDAPSPGITAVCIPTRDRLPTLLRALASFAENGAAHGRRTAFVVMDDSRDPRSARRHRAALRALAATWDRPVLHGSRPAREAFARKVARRAGVAEEVARFALLGDERYASSHGAARNALLLDTVGELSLWVDDDFVCRPGTAPGAEESLALSFRGDPHAYWFGAAEGEVHDLAADVETDFVAAHERLLGRTPGGCVARAREAGMPARIDDRWAMGTLLRPDARVANTFAGIVGDVGGPGRHHPRLTLRGASFHRLVADEDAYAARLHARHVLKSPLRWAVAPDSYCMAGNMGVDGRALPPPFMPVGIAEDIVHGVCRRMVNPAACSGYVPLVVPHLPPDPRAPGAPPPLTFISNRVVSTLMARATGQQPSAALRAAFAWAGAWLQALGTAAEGDFRAEMEALLREVLRIENERAEQELAGRADAPEAWRRSMRAAMDERRALAATDTLASPPDLPGTPADRQSLLQGMIRRYGELLAAWPALMDAAGELRREGRRIASPV
jgi:hypothetical protein